MGSCFSTAGKVTGGASDSNRMEAGGDKLLPVMEGERQKEKEKEKEKGKDKETSAAIEIVHKTGSRGIVPCGKRTDFGFDKDFDNRYVVGKLLGHGQFGYTFVAVDKVHGDKVAVKRIEKAKMVLPIAVEDVKREVKILQALNGHENVVHFYNAFEDANYVYIVMELCEGGELLDQILAKLNCRRK